MVSVITLLFDVILPPQYKTMPAALATFGSMLETYNVTLWPNIFIIPVNVTEIAVKYFVVLAENIIIFSVFALFYRLTTPF